MGASLKGGDGLAGRPGAQRRDGSVGAALSTAVFHLGCGCAVPSAGEERFTAAMARESLAVSQGTSNPPPARSRLLPASSNEHYRGLVSKPVSDVISGLEPILCSQVSNEPLFASGPPYNGTKAAC